MSSAMLQAPLEHQHHMNAKLSRASRWCESKLGVAQDRNRRTPTCTDTQTRRQGVETRTWRRQLATCVPVCTTTLNQESSTMTAPGSMASTSRRTACGPSTSHVYRQRRGCSMSTQLPTGSLRTCAAASQRSSARHNRCAPWCVLCSTTLSATALCAHRYDFSRASGQNFSLRRCAACFATRVHIRHRAFSTLCCNGTPMGSLHTWSTGNPSCSCRAIPG